MPDFKVRAIERTDRAQWEPLWRAYLVFYRAQWSDEVADATFARIFDPLEPVHALVAERGDALIGLTHYLFQRSTWLINSQCYLQDLYVSEAVRGGGVGRALIAAVVRAAQRKRARRACIGTRTRPTPSRASFTTRSLCARVLSSIASILCADAGARLAAAPNLPHGARPGNLWFGCHGRRRPAGVSGWSHDVSPNDRSRSPRPTHRLAPMQR